MRTAILLAMTLASSAVLAEPPSVHSKLVKLYDEPDTWKNSANFYVGARGGIAIPAGADSLAPSAGIELGIAPDFGFGFGLHATWMNRPPGAPVFGIGPASYGFGALADVRFYFPTIEPLTLYPSLGVGFLAGPNLAGRNQVLPLINPGVGAKVKLGSFYGSFEFGFAGFSIPFVNLGFGYEGDRRKQRAEAWAREEEEAAAEKGVEVDLTPRRKPEPPPAPVSEVTPGPGVLKAKLEWTFARGLVVHNQGTYALHGCEVRLPNKKVGRFDAEGEIEAGNSDNIRAGSFNEDTRAPDRYVQQGYALMRCREAQGYVWFGLSGV